MRLLGLLFISLLLVACGENPDRGLVGKSKKTSPVTTSAVIANTSASTTGFSSCFFMTMYSGTDSAYAQSVFSAVQICPALSGSSVVKLKTNASFPTSTRFCLIPLDSQQTYVESCFTVNGQQDVALTTSSAVAVALVRETDLNTMLSYFHALSSNYPPMAFATLH